MVDKLSAHLSQWGVREDEHRFVDREVEVLRERMDTLRLSDATAVGKENKRGAPLI